MTTNAEGQNRANADENAKTGSESEGAGIGVVYMKGATEHADTVSDYFMRNGRLTTQHPCGGFEEFKSSMEGLSSTVTLYVLVDEGFFRLQEKHYTAFKKVLTDRLQSSPKIYLVNYLESEQKFQEVYYKLPEDYRNKFVRKEKFSRVTNGLVNIADNDNMVLQTGHNNVLKVNATADEIHGTQIGGNSTFKYRSAASVNGIVLTIKTPEADHILDVSIKKHIDDKKEHINITLKDLHAEVTATELGSVIIHVEMEEGTKIGPEWLKELITRILSDDIISRLPQGTRMEVNIRASLMLKPLCVDIFDVGQNNRNSQYGKTEKDPDDLGIANTGIPKTPNGQIALKLLRARADTEAKDSKGNTPLHNAACAGNDEVVDILIACGANIKSLNSRLETPLHMALSAGQITCGLKLADKDTVIMTDNGGNTPLHVINKLRESWEKENMRQCEGLKDDSSLLHKAVDSGDVEATSDLIMGGCDVNAVDQQQQTPLHIVSAKTDKLGHILSQFVANKGDINSQNIAGNTLLHNAVLRQDVGFAFDLLNRGADPFIVNNAGETSLYLLTRERKMPTTLFNQRLKKGGDVETKTSNWKTPVEDISYALVTPKSIPPPYLPSA